MVAAVDLGRLHGQGVPGVYDRWRWNDLRVGAWKGSILDYVEIPRSILWVHHVFGIGGSASSHWDCVSDVERIGLRMVCCLQMEYLGIKYVPIATRYPSSWSKYFPGCQPAEQKRMVPSRSLGAIDSRTSNPRCWPKDEHRKHLKLCNERGSWRCNQLSWLLSYAMLLRFAPSYGEQQELHHDLSWLEATTPLLWP